MPPQVPETLEGGIRSLRLLPASMRNTVADGKGSNLTGSFDQAAGAQGPGSGVVVKTGRDGTWAAQHLTRDPSPCFHGLSAGRERHPGPFIPRAPWRPTGPRP